MKAERARLLRLQRLERLRAMAKQAAMAEAASAESTLAQLEALAERTLRLVAGYADPGRAADAAALQQLSRFAGGLQGIAASTAGDARRARGLADEKLADLARAERRRAVVEDRAEAQARRVAKAGEEAVLGSRKALGTDLD